MTKLVMLVNTDLKMKKGKIAAQCAHSAVGIYKKLLKENKKQLIDEWQKNGEAKIALKVNNLEQLLIIHDAGVREGLLTYIVVDAGRTQIEKGSITVCAIGPAPDEVIDKITGHLKLL